MNSLIRSSGHLLALLSWLHLLVLILILHFISSEGPLAHLLLAVKLFPLLVALPGIVRASSYTMQWASMLVLLYMAEGCMHGMASEGAVQLLGWIEFVFAWAAFFGLMVHMRPLKKAAKLAKARQNPAVVDSMEPTAARQNRDSHLRNRTDA